MSWADWVSPRQGCVCACAVSAVSMQRESAISRTELERVQNLRDEVFNNGCIPTWVGISGSVVFAVLAIIVIPFLYTPVKWYEPDQAGLPVICTPHDVSHALPRPTPPPPPIPVHWSSVILTYAPQIS